MRRAAGWLAPDDWTRHRAAPAVAVGLTLLALIASGAGSTAHAAPVAAGTANGASPSAPAESGPPIGSNIAEHGSRDGIAPNAESTSSSVLSTVDLTTGEAESSQALFSQGLHPDAVAVDPASGDVYVANAGSGTVSVVSQATSKVLKYLTVGDDPTSITLNSETQQISAGNLSSTNVSNDLLYVTNRGSNSISVINGSTNKVVSKNYSCGSGPAAAGYGWGTLWVADEYNDSVSGFETPVQSYAGAPLTFQPRGYPCDADEANFSGLGAAFDAPDAVLVHDPDAGPPVPGEAPLILVSAGKGNVVLTFCYFLAGGEGGGTFLVGVAFDDCGTFPVGTDPQGLAWDSANGLYYVANAGSNNVTVASLGTLGAAQEKTKTTITVGSTPEAIAYDPADQDLYVVDNGSDNVTVISGATDHTIGSVDVGVGPDAIAYDSANGDLYVCNWGSDNLSIFNASSFLYHRSIAVGLVPVNLAWDAVSGSVYVGSSDSSEVWLYNASNGTVAGAFAIPGWRDPGPAGLAFDPADGLVFAAQPSTGGLTEYNTSGNVAGGPPGGNVPTFVPTGGGPTAVAFDADGSLVYVANSLSDTVTRLSLDPSSLNLTVGEGPDALAVDPGDGQVFVANSLSNNLSVLGTKATGGPGTISTVPVGTMPDAVVYDPTNGLVFVANSRSNNVSVIDASTDGIVGSVPAGTDPVSLGYDPVNGNVYVANSGSGNLSVFNASTLALVGTVPVGPQPSAVVVDPTNGYVYVAEAGDAALSIVSPAAFPLSLDESGLPAGTTWSVTVGGVPLSTSAGSIGLSELNGSYAYSVAPVPSGGGRGYAWGATPSFGTVTVSGGPTSVGIAFDRVYFEPVTFEARGLPAGANWSVTGGGTTTNDTTVSSTSPPPSSGEITFYAPNGTFPFSVTPPPGFGIASVAGKGILNLTSGTVSGPTTWRVSFGLLTPLNFEVLPFPPFEGYAGTSWSVSLLPAVQRGGPAPVSGASNESGAAAQNDSRVSFSVPAGAAYKYAITGPGSPYRLSPTRGSVHVPKDPGPSGTIVRVRFDLETSKVSWKESGVPRDEDWAVTITDGSSLAFHYPFSETVRGSGRLTFRLPAGAYAYTASIPGSATPNVSGVVEVAYPAAPTLAHVAFGSGSAMPGCFSFTNNGTPVGSEVCNANADDIDVGFSSTATGSCVDQFTAGGTTDGPSIACPLTADGLEVSWAGAASGPVIGGCTWLNGTTPLGGCPVPVPAPTGFVFDAAIVYVGWTVDGNLTGTGLAAPPGANGLTFTT